MPDHPIRPILDLDPEFASQWGIEPEDAYSMLVTTAELSTPVILYNLLRGVGRPRIEATHLSIMLPLGSLGQGCFPEVS